MIAGSLALGGPQIPLALPLPPASLSVTGNIGARTRGQWAIVADMESRVLNIPARDKQVQLITNSFHIESTVSQLDSMDGSNYKAKLQQLLSDAGPGFQAVIINHNVSTHSSFGIVTAGSELYLWGLYDDQLGQAYLLWSSDMNEIVNVAASNPLRYLVYRFPVLQWDCLFIQIETICIRWWRWTKNGTTLRAFNALERRLLGPLVC